MENVNYDYPDEVALCTGATLEQLEEALIDRNSDNIPGFLRQCNDEQLLGAIHAYTKDEYRAMRKDLMLDVREGVYECHIVFDHWGSSPVTQYDIQKAFADKDSYVRYVRLERFDG